jgi:uncharacterized alpha-E superfamily protein
MEDARMVRHKLTDEQWECIESFFKKRAKTGRPPAPLPARAISPLETPLIFLIHVDRTDNRMSSAAIV